MPVLNPATARFAVIGGLSFTAVLGFSLGHLTGLVEAPLAGAPGESFSKTADGGSGDRASSQMPGVAAGGQGGSAFAGLPGEGGEALSIGQITAGRPLADWLKRLMDQEDAHFRVRNLLRLIDALQTPEEMETALQAVLDARGSGRNGLRATELGMIMEKLARLDPRRGIEFARQQSGEEKNTVVAAAVRGWTHVDSEAALQWALADGKEFASRSRNRDGSFLPEDNVPLVTVLGHLAATDLDKALKTAGQEIGRPTLATDVEDIDQAINQIPGLVRRPYPMMTGEEVPVPTPDGAVIVSPATLSFTGANTYVGTTIVSSGTLTVSFDPNSFHTIDVNGRTLTLNGIGAFQLAPTNPEIGRLSQRAADLLAAEMIDQRGIDAAKQSLASVEESGFKDAYTRRLADRLAQQDAAGAAEWITTLPDGKPKSQALASVVQSWGAEDINAAGIFLAQLLPSTGSDAARENYAKLAFSADPEAAFIWAATITDQAQRDRAVVDLGEKWLWGDINGGICGLTGAQVSALVSESQWAAIVGQFFLNRGGYY